MSNNMSKSSKLKYEIVQNGSLFGVSTSDGTVIFPCVYGFLEILSFDGEARYVMCSLEASNEHLNEMGLLGYIFEDQRFKYRFYHFKTPLLLMNLNGELLYQVEVDDILLPWDWKILNCGLIAYKQNDKWGAKDEYGKNILLPTFDDIYSSSDVVLYLSAGKLGMLDKFGKILSVPQFDQAAYLDYNVCELLCGPYEPGTILLSDEYRHARPVVSTQNWNADIYKSSTLRIVNNQIYEYFNKEISNSSDFKILRQVRIDATNFDQYVIVKIDDYYYLFSLKDGVLQNSKCVNYLGVYDDLIFLQDVDRFGNILWGVYSLKTQSQILPISYSNITYYGDGFLIASKEEDKSLLYKLDENSNPKLIIPYECCEIEILTSNLFSYKVFSSENTYHLKNQTNPILLGISTRPFEVLYNGLIIFGNQKSIGLCDQNGLIVLPCKYEEIVLRKDNNYDIKACGGGWGVLSSSNFKEIFTPSYRYKIEYGESQSEIILEDFNSFKKGVISIDGTVIIPTIYDEIKRIDNGYICKLYQGFAYLNRKFDYAYVLYDTKGNIIAPLSIKEITAVGNFVFDGNTIYDRNLNEWLIGCKKINLVTSPYCTESLYRIQLGTENESLLIDGDFNLIMPIQSEKVQSIPLGTNASDLLSVFSEYSLCNFESIYYSLNRNYFYYFSEFFRSIMENAKLNGSFCLIDKRDGMSRIYSPRFGWSDVYDDIHFVNAYVNTEQLSDNILTVGKILILTKRKDTGFYRLQFFNGEEINSYDYFIVIYKDGHMLGLRKVDTNFVFDYINYEEESVYYFEATEPFISRALSLYQMQRFFTNPSKIQIPTDGLIVTTSKFKQQIIRDRDMPISVVHIDDFENLKYIL